MEKLHLTPVHRDACLCIFALCAKIDILGDESLWSALKRGSLCRGGVKLCPLA